MNKMMCTFICRSISSENPRIVKTTIPTPTTPIISKTYFDPESYPYYTLYDDDVSIYKDDGKY